MLKWQDFLIVFRLVQALILFLIFIGYMLLLFS
jgi:hypothetical protein